jgi:tetraacyldisaccharide 4'-kinase
MTDTPALAPLSLLYGAAVRARVALYRRGLFASHDVGAPVVSVGNLTTGGTGKTPLVEWAARTLAREGLRVCVLSRGYGRERASRRVVVSDGERLLAGAREGGDEPRLLAENLLGLAAVVCDADRVAAAVWAREELGAEVFVLDDGFQHLRIARDLDIVAVDATAPWGGGHLLPRGRLREPPEGLRRASGVVITRADLAEDVEALRAAVARYSAGRARVFTSRVRTRGVRPLSEGRGVGAARADAAVPQPVAAFCGLGNPRALFEHLRRDGHDLRHTRAFRDHHFYTAEDLAAVAREARERGARALLTTAKDAVKLGGLDTPLPCFVVEVETVIDNAAALADIVREATSPGGLAAALESGPG